MFKRIEAREANAALGVLTPLGVTFERKRVRQHLCPKAPGKACDISASIIPKQYARMEEKKIIQRKAEPEWIQIFDT